MKAAVFHGPHETLTMEQLDIDEPMSREVVVKVVASGVCRSDLHFIDGLYPYPAPAVLGHEAAGIVEAVGDQVTQFKPGDHVISCLSVFCGNCKQCLSGKPNLCRSPERSRGLGDPPKLKYSKSGETVHQFLNISSFAEKMLLHENAIVKIVDDMPLDRAALIGCGVMTGVGAALNTANVEAGSTCVVFGAGGVGLAAIQGCRIAGAGMIIAVDMIESKLGLAKELGATHTIDASQGDPVGKIREMTDGGADYSFEAIGLSIVATQAFDCIAPGGTATIIGMIPVGQKVELDGPAFLSEKKIQGCNMGSNRFRIDMPRYVDFYKRGLLNLDDMITQRRKLEDVNDALRAMKAGEVARSVLMFD